MILENGSPHSHFVKELIKRRVFTSALLYVPFAWITTEVLTFLFDKFLAPPWAEDLTAAAFVAGFPAFIVLAWTFDIGLEGITRTTGSRREGYAAILFATLIMLLGTAGLFYRIESHPQALAFGSPALGPAPHVIEALDIRLSPRELAVLTARQTGNQKAYDAYLRGWSLVESFHISFDGAEDKLMSARAHFGAALAIEPGYTRAIAGLSMVESYAVMLGIKPKAHLKLARRLAEKALALDDNLYESHFAMAKVLATGEDSRAAIVEYRKVIYLDPQNGYAWCEMSDVLNTLDPVSAESAALEAIRFRPAYSLAYYNLGAALQKQDRLDEAVDAYQQSLQLDPGNQGLRGIIGQLNGELAQQQLE